MFTIATGGIHAKHPVPFFMSRPDGSSDYVLLIIKAKVNFVIGNDHFKITPNTALLIRPNIPYEYKSDHEYTDDWLHFDGSADDLDAIKDLPFHYPIPLSSSSRYTQYIQQILWERSYAAPLYRAENADMLFRVLLNTLRCAIEEKDTANTYSPYRIRLQNLRLSMLAQPWNKYMPEEIARSMGISVSYFQHQYTALFGVSFQSDLISLRIDHAKYLISKTNLTMEKIAEMCGYSNEVHFYRQFKKYAGLTPAAFRKNMR
ncbi:MAG: helix-turn-helix domain-containing protein [Lachnospiraceae bacterium]|nr:helix-turn-helix domain-containing protein [Lachnospiraceae bacterium]